MSETKTCSKCGKTKSLVKFRPPTKSTGRIHSWCKDCLNGSCRKNYWDAPEKARVKHRVYSKKMWSGTTEHCVELQSRWKEKMKKYNKNRQQTMSETDRRKRHEQSIRWQKNNPEKMQGYYLKQNYSLSLGEYNQMLADQGGVCAICGLPPQTRKMGVDHDHVTGKIRGLLCHNCNVSIGLMKDNQDTLAKAIAYLREHS